MKTSLASATGVSPWVSTFFGYPVPLPSLRRRILLQREQPAGMRLDARIGDRVAPRLVDMGDLDHVMLRGLRRWNAVAKDRTVAMFD